MKLLLNYSGFSIITNIDKIKRKKYLLCMPQGGLNDQLSVIKKCYIYCRLDNRTLLINTTKSCYGVNLSDYIKFINTNDVEIICDLNIIKNIINSHNFTIYPNIDKSILWTMNVYWTNKGCHIRDLEVNVSSDLNTIYKEDILIYCNCGSDNPCSILKIIQFKDNVKNEYINRLNKIPKPYLAIHIRNTDYKCDYKKLYYDNEKKILNEKNIYVATDDINALNFFKSKRNVYNFTTFQNKRTSNNLHYDKSISSNTHFMDTLCDLLILGSSYDILTISKGGYIKLAKTLCYNKFLLYSLLK